MLNAQAIHKILGKVILRNMSKGAHGIVVVAGLLIMRIHLNLEGTTFGVAGNTFSFANLIISMVI